MGVATWRGLRRRIGREEWAVARSIHSPLVMLLAATPGVGSFAYLAAKPVRSNRLLLRVMADAALAKRRGTSTSGAVSDGGSPAPPAWPSSVRHSEMEPRPESHGGLTSDPPP
jgi:hypothetical protein